MARHVKISSIETLEAFRSRLILFLDKAGSAMDDAGDDVRRTRIWLQQDQRLLWEGKVKRLRKQLEQAEAELFTSRLSAMTEHSAARQMAVTRLRRLLREAEEKLKLVKKWNRSFDNAVDPLVKKLEGDAVFPGGRTSEGGELPGECPEDSGRVYAGTDTRVRGGAELGER